MQLNNKKKKIKWCDFIYFSTTHCKNIRDPVLGREPSLGTTTLSYNKYKLKIFRYRNKNII
jgi:hypothetical protein